MLSSVLYQRIRHRADIEDSDYVTDLELDQMSRESYRELQDIIINTLGDEAPTTRTTHATVADTDSVTIAATNNTHRIARMDLLSDNRYWTPMNRGVVGSDVMDSRSQQWRDGRDIRYYATRGPRVDAATSSGHTWTIMFDPTPAAVYSVRVWSIPGPAFTIVAGLVTVYPDDFPEYVVNDVAGKLAARQEIDTKDYESERERLRVRIEKYYRPMQLTQPRLQNDHRSNQAPRRNAWWKR